LAHPLGGVAKMKFVTEMAPVGVKAWQRPFAFERQSYLLGWKRYFVATAVAVDSAFTGHSITQLFL